MRATRDTTNALATFPPGNWMHLRLWVLFSSTSMTLLAGDFMTNLRKYPALPYEFAKPSDPSEGEPAREMRPEEVFARLQAQTRRHFLRSLSAGVGTMFLSLLASQETGFVKAAERNSDG